MTILEWSPSGGDFFGQLQWNGLVFSPNVFGHLANGGEGATLARWNLPIEDGPASVENRSNCLTGDIETDDNDNPLPCQFDFSGSFDPDNTFTIRQYSQVVLGSNAGYEQTWGRSCGSLNSIAGVFRGGAGGQGPNQAFDLTPANSAVGYPSLVSDMPDTTMSVQWRECGDSGGCYNIFTDIYLHEVNDDSLLPTDSSNGGNAQTQYRGTINGISQNDTKLWNFNFWHNQFPSCFGSAQQVTNGEYMGSTEIEPGKNVDIYLRREGFSGNNFAFLAFSFNPAQTNHDMDINAYVDWATSAATGAGTFMDIVWNNANGARATVAAEMLNPPSQGGVTPLARTLRRPAGDMVIDGIQQGSEVWGVNPTGNVASICYDRLGFTVGNDEFGKVAPVEEPCPDCDSITITGLPATVQAGQSVFLSGASDGFRLRLLKNNQTEGASTTAPVVNGTAIITLDADLLPGEVLTVAGVEPGCDICFFNTITTTVTEEVDTCIDCDTVNVTGLPDEVEAGQQITLFGPDGFRVRLLKDNQSTGASTTEAFVGGSATIVVDSDTEHGDVLTVAVVETGCDVCFLNDISVSDPSGPWLQGWEC